MHPHPVHSPDEAPSPRVNVMNPVTGHNTGHHAATTNFNYMTDLRSSANAEDYDDAPDVNANGLRWHDDLESSALEERARYAQSDARLQQEYEAMRAQLMEHPGYQAQAAAYAERIQADGGTADEVDEPWLSDTPGFVRPRRPRSRKARKQRRRQAEFNMQEGEDDLKDAHSETP